jgi:hypothetical protein
MQIFYLENSRWKEFSMLIHLGKTLVEKGFLVENI